MIKKRLRKSLNLSFYKLPAKWTIFELWQTIDTRNQMSTTERKSSVQFKSSHLR